jgi:hypothetical protein
MKDPGGAASAGIFLLPLPWPVFYPARNHPRGFSILKGFSFL